MPTMQLHPGLFGGQIFFALRQLRGQPKFRSSQVGKILLQPIKWFTDGLLDRLCPLMGCN